MEIFSSSNVALKLDYWYSLKLYGLRLLETLYNKFLQFPFAHAFAFVKVGCVGMFDFFGSDERTKVRTNRQR